MVGVGVYRSRGWGCVACYVALDVVVRALVITFAVSLNIVSRNLSIAPAWGCRESQHTATTILSIAAVEVA